MPTLLLHHMSVELDEPVQPETIALLLSPAGDEALAFYVLTSCLTAHPLPVHLRAVFDQIEEAIQVAAMLDARMHYLRQRMDAIAQVNDPVAQFERLVGYAAQESNQCLVAPY